MKSIKVFLEKMSKTSSLNEKRKIFKEFSGNETILKIFKYTYDNVEFTFGIKPTRLDFTKNGSSTNFEEMFILLDNLNNRTFSGNLAVVECNKFIENSDKDISSIFYKILDRDLKIGFSKKEFNKLVSGQFKCKNVSYCRCDTLSEKTLKKFKFPAFIQLKCDGSYREAFVLDGRVSFKTRSGEPYVNPVLAEVMKNFPDGYYTGEFTLGNAEEAADRATGNGNLNSDNPDYENIHFTVWDYLTEEEYTLKVQSDYSERFAKLNDIIKSQKLIHVVPTKEVNNIDEALKITSEWMDRGLEGGVLKSKSMKFKNGTSKEQLKIKLKVDVEVRCIGFLEGTKGTKYEGRNKVIVFQNDEGTIKGQCSGMTDDMVDEVTRNPEKYIGKVLSVQFNDLTKAEGNDYYALSHPRFVQWRMQDKDETDTLEKAFELRNMARSLK